MPLDRALAPEGQKAGWDLGRRHFNLAALVAEFRQASGAYVLTSVAHGARSEGRQRTLQRLQILGVFEQPDPRSNALAAAAPVDRDGCKLPHRRKRWRPVLPVPRRRPST